MVWPCMDPGFGCSLRTRPSGESGPERTDVPFFGPPPSASDVSCSQRHLTARIFFCFVHRHFSFRSSLLEGAFLCAFIFTASWHCLRQRNDGAPPPGCSTNFLSFFFFFFRGGWQCTGRRSTLSLYNLLFFNAPSCSSAAIGCCVAFILS